TRGIARMLEIEFGRRNIVDGAPIVTLAHGPLIPGPLGAFELALRGGDCHLRKVCLLLAREQLPADFDLLARQGGVEAVQGSPLALILVVEFGAIDRREYLTLRDSITRTHRVA